MYTKFYDNTLATKFVKELVAKTNIPLISTWKPGDFAIRGMLYLTKDTIWKCQHTGYPESINSMCPEDHPSYTSANSYPLEDLRFFKRVSPYVFGEEYHNLTGRYESKILGYDSTTHFYLGQYLRMMRDVYDLDLMPFYNCFNNEYLSDIDFDETGKISEILKFQPNDKFKIVSVPVRFGQKYMIAIDSDLPIECILCIYGPKGYIKDLSENLNSLNNEEGEEEDNEEGKKENHNTYKKFNKTQFYSPIIYETVSWHQLYSPSKDSNLDGDEQTIYMDEDYKLINDKAYDLGLGQFEKYLRLLIKIPKNNNSSIVVIEGDYSLVKGLNLLKKSFEGTSSVTWSNPYLLGLTVNSKTVLGDWVRPEIILNNHNETNSLGDRTNNFKTYSYNYIVSGGDIKEANGKLSLIFKENESLNEREAFLSEVIKNSLELLPTTKLSYHKLEEIEEVPSFKNFSPLLLSPLGLLQINDGNIYAFSDRLIEYLTQNAINHLDAFGKDIERVLTYSKSDTNWIKNLSRYSGDIVPGVWDKGFLEYLFDLAKNSDILQTKIDLTGYVDKDVESVITRGQEV